MNKILNLGYFYPELLNLYGDNGNVEILARRAKQMGIEVNIHLVSVDTAQNDRLFENVNLVFMGGGPDSGQKQMYEDLKQNKAEFLKKYIESGNVGLYICGAYQLLGRYYKSSDGSMLEGLGIFDLYTEHFGSKKPRCIGNTVAEIVRPLYDDPLFPKTTGFGKEIVGFENHGGRTYLGNNISAFARIKKGFGNNSSDGTEGALYKNSIGTYFHGPFLSRNPHVADYLIFKALNLSYEEVSKVPKIDDTLILSAHTASKKLKQ